MRSRAGRAWRTLASTPVAARLLGTTRRYEQALAEAQRLVETDPTSPTGWHAMAEALAGLRRDEEADRYQARALALAPDSATIWKRGSRGRAARAAMEAATDPAFP